MLAHCRQMRFLWLLLPNYASRARLQLHLALSRLVLGSALPAPTANSMLKHLSCGRLLAGLGGLIGHDIRRENALLRLLSFQLKGRQWTQLVVHAARCRVLTRTHSLVLVPVHAGVHLSLDTLLHLRALLTGVHVHQFGLVVDWGQHAFVELH